MPRVQLLAFTPKRRAWDKGRLVGQKRPLLPKQVWAIRARLELVEIFAIWLCSTSQSAASCAVATWSRSRSMTLSEMAGCANACRLSKAKRKSLCIFNWLKTREKLCPVGSNLRKLSDANYCFRAVSMIARTYQHVSMGVWFGTGLFPSG